MLLQEEPESGLFTFWNLLEKSLGNLLVKVNLVYSLYAWQDFTLVRAGGIKDQQIYSVLTSFKKKENKN